MKLFFIASIASLAATSVGAQSVDFNIVLLNGATGAVKSNFNNLCWVSDGITGGANGNLRGTDCDTDDAAQHFFYDPATKEMRSELNRDKCIDVSGGVDGTNMLMWECKESANQKWTQDSTGRLRIETGTNNKCMTMMADKSIQMTTCGAGTNQQFSFLRATLPPTTQAPTSRAPITQPPTAAPVTQPPTVTASSSGDPHFVTFAGEKYDVSEFNFCEAEWSKVMRL